MTASVVVTLVNLNFELCLGVRTRDSPVYFVHGESDQRVFIVSDM
jgi:hypothetical protein